MPEGHTIHRLAHDHGNWFAGQNLIVMSPQGRFAKEAKRLSGRKLLKTKAIGKHLFYYWDADNKGRKAKGSKSSKSPIVMHVHLGLYGKFRIHKNPAPEPRGAVRVRVIGADKAFDLNGPTRCEILNQRDLKKLLERLGPDPLDSNANCEPVWNRFCKTRKTVGGLLLDQSVIAGVGNVYRAEILFQLGIHPETKGKELSREQFDDLWDLTVKFLQIGFRYNRIITVDRSDVDKPLSRLSGKERLTVYKKVKCTRCGSKIRKWTVAARTMYACETCQV